MSVPINLLIARRRAGEAMDAVAAIELMLVHRDYDLARIRTLLKRAGYSMLDVEHFTDLSVDNLRGLAPGTTSDVLATHEGDVSAIDTDGLLTGEGSVSEVVNFPPERLRVLGTDGNITRIGPRGHYAPPAPLPPAVPPTIPPTIPPTNQSA